jgi:hypothetical protein
MPVEHASAQTPIFEERNLWMHFESAKALYQPDEKIDRWIACHAALGHRPVNGAYHRWIRQQWRAFATVLGLNACAGCRAVEIHYGKKAHSMFDTWLIEQLKEPRPHHI